uniref:Gypsy retrotransposon integrase-like protein 1 n=1 Tax=Cyprinus carpio TaxID=7962 RepID=A0A8C1LPZ1_CYPCA
MEELLKHLTEVSIRQQQIMEHMASRQGETERELAALRMAAGARTPLPDPRVQATQLLPRMTSHDDVTTYLQMFETVATREAWPKAEWARIIAPLLTGEAQRAYFTLPPELNESYEELKKEILGRMGLSPFSAAQLFNEWAFNPRQPARAQVANLSRLAQHWLLAGCPNAHQVAERVVVDRLLRALPRPLRQAAGMRNPANVDELVEAIELAEATQHREVGERAPPFPQRVVQERIICDRFHWPGLEAEVRRFCQACPTCQRTSPQTPPPSPLIPLPIIEVPFERIGMDLVGPLPKSARGHEHILVIVDYATRYPEAIPLRKATTKAIAQELFLLCSRVGIPSQILTNQGTPFMSRMMADLCKLLKVQQLRTMVYHPQTDGLVERFNQTLKQMLRRVTAEDNRDWDKMLPYVLFGVREVPQASTGFTPFELLFGRQPRGLLDVVREAWEQQPAVHRTTVEHVREMRERIDRVMPIVREHLVKAQQAQQRHYNRAAQPREFQRGDHVLVLVPTAACKSFSTWQGPYTITEKVGPVTYRVRQPGRRRRDQLYHINLLKRWAGTGPQLSAYTKATPVVVDMDPQLYAAQKTELQHLVSQFPDVFSPQPGRTHVLEHDVRTPPGTIVRQRPYRVREARRHAIEEEVQEMLRLGVIEPSHSPWSSPIVMVPKPDGTLRFCNDFRRLNEVSEFDCYPMPHVDELFDRLGRVWFISTLDLTKGYWQVPLSEQAKPKTAFSTPNGHWQYRVLPFGLHGAPATFQRLMDVLLRPHQAYAAAYIDDVVIHSETWEDHLERLRRVLLELRLAGLTANPRKCHLALSEAKYLGYQVGRGLIRPQKKKVAAILSAPRPTYKTQVRAFLGLAGYYRCFIPNFSSLASPLTDLTRKGQPEKVPWTSETEAAFHRIKAALTTEPVLRAPDFNCPFLVQTDASNTCPELSSASPWKPSSHICSCSSRAERPHLRIIKSCLLKHSKRTQR